MVSHRARNSSKGNSRLKRSRTHRLSCSLALCSHRRGSEFDLHKKDLRQNLYTCQMRSQFLVDLLQADLVNKLAPFDDGGPLFLIPRARLRGCRRLVWGIPDFVKYLGSLHEPREQDIGVVLDEKRVENLKHGFVRGCIIASGGTVNGIQIDDMHNGREKLVHALAVATSVRVDLAIDEENVQNHGLHSVLVIIGLVREPLHVLLDLFPDDLILPQRVPWRLPRLVNYISQNRVELAMAHLGVVCQGVHGEFRQGFWVLNELEEVLPADAVVLPANASGLRPADFGTLLGQEECLEWWPSARPHISASGFWVRPTFQQTERQPVKQGLEGPLPLTARCRSATLPPWLLVACHRTL